MCDFNKALVEPITLTTLRPPTLAPMCYSSSYCSTIVSIADDDEDSPLHDAHEQ